MSYNTLWILGETSCNSCVLIVQRPCEEAVGHSTCSVASTSCQEVPSTAPWQWARFNRVRIHWMFLAVSLTRDIQLHVRTIYCTSPWHWTNTFLQRNMRTNEYLCWIDTVKLRLTFKGWLTNRIGGSTVWEWNSENYCVISWNWLQVRRKQYVQTKCLWFVVHRIGFETPWSNFPSAASLSLHIWIET